MKVTEQVDIVVENIKKILPGLIKSGRPFDLSIEGVGHSKTVLRVGNYKTLWDSQKSDLIAEEEAVML